MNRASREALVILLLGAACGLAGNRFRPEPLPLSTPPEAPPTPEAGSGLPAVSAAEAARSWEAGAFFLDVREPDQFQDRRVAGALPLPVSSLEDSYFRTVANLGVEVPIVVYGAGPDSFEVRRVAQYLRDLGHADVALVVCGVGGLIDAGVDPDSGPAEDLW